MLRRSVVVSALAAAALLGIYSVGGTQEKDKQKIVLDGIECLFCKMEVSKDAFAEYKGARVFFGCAGCPEAFKKDQKKFAVKANSQLVATRQARQKACPVTGKPHKDQFKLTLAKAQVAFCCPNCQARTAKLKGDEQLQRVFSDAAFKKSFQVVKWEQQKGS